MGHDAQVDQQTGARTLLLPPNAYLFALGHQRRVTLEVADALMYGAHAHAIAHYGDRPLVGIMDWSAMEGYDSDARAALTEWARSIRHQIEACCMVVPTTNAMVMMGLQVSATALRVLGVSFEFYSSVEEALDRHGLTLPRAVPASS